MNKILIAASLISSFSLYSVASERFADLENKPSEKTYFRALEEMYNNGTKPDLALISNFAWSGRCFDHMFPSDVSNDVSAGIAWAIRPKDESAVGPILSSKKTTK